jgi:hypothetical protein
VATLAQIERDQVGEVDFVFYHQYVRTHLLWPRACQRYVTAR